MQAPAPVAGQKRKRNQAAPPADVPVPHFAHESKNQRKKRRKAERLAAEQARVPDAMLVETPPSPFVASNTRFNLAPLPDRPFTFNDTQQSEILPPVSWATSITTPTAVASPPFFPLPPKPSPLATSVTPFPSTFPHFPAPPSLLQSPEHRQQPPHILPLPSPTIPAPSYSPLNQPQGPDATATEQAPLAQKKILGMPRESDKGRQGIFPTEALRHPLPHPTRTLVLAPIPKKFRNAEFVRHWAKKFAKAQPLRIEVDKMQGKALVEFQNVASAEMAHSSIRLVGEGKEHIRAWWYRGPAKNPSDLEEGEIEEGVVEEPPPPPQPSKKKQNKSQKKADKKKAQVATQFHRQQQAVPTPHATYKNATIPGRPLTTPMLASLPQPVPPPLPSAPPYSTTLPVAASSRTMNAPAPARRSPNPYAYRGWADAVVRSDDYGMIGEDGGSDDGYLGPPAGMLRGYYGASSRSSNVFQEEEQAMDLESDEEEARVREEEYSPDSRYDALAEPRAGVDNAGADSASIASSRAGSVDQETAGQMRVDDDATVRLSPSVPGPSSKPARKASSSLIPLRPPGKALSPSVFTMVEPPAAPVTAPVVDVPDAAKAPEVAHLTVESNTALAGNASTQPDRVPSADRAPCQQDLPPTTSSSLPAATHVPTPGLPQRPDSASTRTLPVVHADSSTTVVHTKRTLEEKQRELEGRIARAKEELARKSAVSRVSASRHTSPEEEPKNSASSIGHAVNKATHSADTISAESELRRSALQSRKKARGSSAEDIRQTNDVAAVDSGRGDDASAPAVVAMASPINFDDLAVSFINETLQIVRSSPPSDPPSAATSLSSHSVPSTAPTTPQVLPVTPSFVSVRPTQATEKSLLASRQKRLEQHLAETKMLMTKLGAARTKAEKDSILSTLRERQR